MRILRALGRFGLEVLQHIAAGIVGIGVVLLFWWILDLLGINPVILL